LTGIRINYRFKWLLMYEGNVKSCIISGQNYNPYFLLMYIFDR
jgi:hypothetical protein